VSLPAKLTIWRRHLGGGYRQKPGLRAVRGVEEEVKRFRNRPLEDSYLYLWNDAT